MENTKIFELQTEIENTEELREIYIQALPKLILEIHLLEKQAKRLKELKKQVNIMAEEIGPFENDYFMIFEKEEKSVKVDYKQLEQAIKDIQKELLETEDYLTNEQQEIFDKLQNSMKTDIEVKKPAEKLKLLNQINPTKAEEIKETIIKQTLVLKEKKSLLEDIKEQEETNCVA